MMRVDTAIRRRIQGLTRSQVEEACKAGWVLDRGGKALAKGMAVESPQELDLSLLEACLAAGRVGSYAFNVPVLHETPDFVVVDKPTGIPSHPLKLSDQHTITQWLFQTYPETLREFAEIQPTVTPHRLDTGTTGVLVVAKTRAAYSWWRSQFERHAVTKRYLAWCEGKPSARTFTIDLPIAHHPSDRSKMVAVLDASVAFRNPAQPAITHVVVQKMTESHTLVEVACESGVTHQVRVHLASAGLPLVGDRHYGAKNSAYASHLLRAVSLHTERFSFSAPTDRFIGLF